MRYQDPRAIISLCSLVRERANSLIADKLQEAGIKDIIPAHGLLIHALSKGPMTMGELATATGRKKNSLTSLAQTLEKNGYITRSVNPQDARVQNVELTIKGRELQRVQEELSLGLQQAVWQGIDEAEQNATMQILSKVAENLRSNSIL